MSVYDEARAKARVTPGLYLDVGQQLVDFFEERQVTVVTYREIMAHFVYGPEATLEKHEFKGQAKKLLESFNKSRHWHYALPGVAHKPAVDVVRQRRKVDSLKAELNRLFLDCDSDWDEFKRLVWPVLKEIKSRGELD